MPVTGEVAALDGAVSWLATVLAPYPPGGNPFALSVRQALGAAGSPVVLEVNDQGAGVYTYQATPSSSGIVLMAITLPYQLLGLRFGPRSATPLQNVSFWCDYAMPPATPPELTGTDQGPRSFAIPSAIPPVVPEAPLPVLLTEADCPAIRAAILVSLSDTDLPCEAIEYAFPWATQQVVNIDPQAGTWAVDSPQAQRAHDAAVLFAAAYLAPSVTVVIREWFQGYAYHSEPPDMIERARQLIDMATAMIHQNVTDDMVTTLMPSTFTLAQQPRGDVSTGGYPGSYRRRIW